MAYYYFGQCPECKWKHPMFSVDTQITDAPYLWICPHCGKKTLFKPQQYLMVDQNIISKELPYRLVEETKTGIKEIGAFRDKTIYDIFSKRHKKENTTIIKMF